MDPPDPQILRLMVRTPERDLCQASAYVLAFCDILQTMTDRGIDLSLRRGTGEPVEPHSAIFPIIAEIDEQCEAVGTGFFVSPSGLFLTAAHVLRAHPLESFVILQLGNTPEGTYAPRKVEAALMHRKTDIAFGVLDPLWNRDTCKPLFPLSVALTSVHPEVGEHVSCYSFAQTITAHRDELHFVFPQSGWETGTILQIFLKGRDRIVQPGICFETSLNIPGGGSGGPVFNSKGQVFGVVSSGITEAEVTYVASVVELLDFPFAQEVMPDGSEGEPLTLRGLGMVDVAFDPKEPPPRVPPR